MDMYPDKLGYFGAFGGRFVPETLIYALNELESFYARMKRDPGFCRQLGHYLKQYAGRPTPLYFAAAVSAKLGISLYLKREDLLHTGAHKINNTLGQALLAVKMKKKRLIAETGAGQHGVATATVAALFKLKCQVYMGTDDIARQALNVYRMKLLGADVIPVNSGSKTLKDATSQALRDWVANVGNTHYIIGSAVGPHPYPMIVRDFQSVIGKEARRQVLRQTGRLPDYLVACVGGGSNAAGLFNPFFHDKGVRFIGVEAGGYGLVAGRHAATLVSAKVGVLHGAKSNLLQDKYGQVLPTHSVSAGLDYPGVGPEHAYYQRSGRARYVTATDKQALAGFSFLSRQEGIIPALEPAHAIGYLKESARRMKRGAVVILCLSGRGDKDMDIVRNSLNTANRKPRLCK